MYLVSLVSCLVLFSLLHTVHLSSSPDWVYVCKQKLCERQSRSPTASDPGQMSLTECKLTCGNSGRLWPRPSGVTVLSNSTVAVLVPEKATITAADSAAGQLMTSAWTVFQQRLANVERFHSVEMKQSQGGQLVKDLEVMIEVPSDNIRLAMTTDESYKLLVTDREDKVNVRISSATFFGARHALETLSQLMFIDADQGVWKILDSVKIEDKPAYPFRAITLDTSRNFISVDALKRTIDLMSFNKLNTLHWHIMDTHSFPMVIPDEPRFTRFGAYSSRHIYSEQQVTELVQFARVRGVRILPEFDSPAHVGFGWQWGNDTKLGQLAVCVNKEPWQSYCVEPPCGQLNIANDQIYLPIKQILSYFQKQFDPEILHIGGDEVNFNCWRSEPDIRDYIKKKNRNPDEDEPFLEEWYNFNDNMLSLWKNITNKTKDQMIVWTSKLTEHDKKAQRLKKDNYIIQVWTDSKDDHICDLLKRGHQLIMSNTDALYFDCGFSSWVGTGNNWCAPFKSWQTVYDNSLRAIVQKCAQKSAGSEQNSSGGIIGASAAMWSEQNDDHSLDNKLWPRASALAERLWSDPDTVSTDASDRYTYHHQRLVQQGANPESVQPLYCMQYEGRCRLQ